MENEPVDVFDDDILTPPMNSNKLQRSELDRQEYQETLITVPPDGGWGWMVVIGAFFTFFIVDGMFYSFGVFLENMSEDLQCSKSKVSLTAAITTGVFCFSGPFAASLVNNYGYRIVGVAGSTLAIISCAVSSLAKSIYPVYFTYGVMGGIGFGMINMPAVIAVGFYFERWRGIATGVASCGAGLGGVVLPFVFTLALEKLGWKQTFRLLSALCLLTLMCTLLFRPLPPTMVQMVKLNPVVSGNFFTTYHNRMYPTLSELSEVPTTMLLQPRRFKSSEVMITTTYPSSSLHFKSKRSKPNSDSDFMTAEVIVKDEEIPEETITLESKTGSQYKNLRNKKDKNVLTEKTTSLFASKNRPMNPMRPTYREADIIVKDEEVPEGSITLESNPGSQYKNMRNKKDNVLTEKITSLFASKNRPINPMRPMYRDRDDIFYNTDIIVKDEELPEESITLESKSGSQYKNMRNKKDNNMLTEKTTTLFASKNRPMNPMRPMYRDDIFYNSSFNFLQKYKRTEWKSSIKTAATISKSNLEYHMSVTRLATQRDLDETGCRRAICTEAVKRTLATMLDYKLLMSPSFLLIAMNATFMCLGYFTTYVFLEDRARQSGMPADQTSWLVPVISITNIIGRVACGFMATCPRVSCAWLSSFCLTLGGVATILSVHFDQMVAQFCYAVLFGSLIACIPVLRTLIIVETLGLDKLTNAVGLILIFQGVACLIGLSIAGVLREATGDYRWTFYFSGATEILAALFFIPLKRVAVWEQSQGGEK